jgi:hypothetical protein
MASPGMLRRVALVRTDVSEELSASVTRVTRIGELGTALAVTSNRRTLRSERRSLVELSHKTALDSRSVHTGQTVALLCEFISRWESTRCYDEMRESQCDTCMITRRTTRGSIIKPRPC